MYIYHLIANIYMYIYIIFTLKFIIKNTISAYWMMNKVRDSNVMRMSVLLEIYKL